MEIITAFYITLGFSIFTGVVGYYFGERGFAGVKNDLNNAKLDIAHIKGNLNANPVTVIQTPVQTPQGTFGGTDTTTPVRVG